MKTLTSLFALTLFLTSSLFSFSQDIVYVSGTDTFQTLTSDYVLTGDSLTVTDTVFSDTSIVLANANEDKEIEFTIDGGYETYTLFYNVTNASGFNGDFFLRVNGVLDTTISYIVTPIDPNYQTELIEGDLVNMTITDNDVSGAQVISNVVNTTIYVFIEKTVSVNDNFNTFSYQMYPNPVIDRLNFSFDNYPSQVIFQLFDMGGRLVNEGQMFNNTINVSELPRGSYILRLNVDGNTFSDRFIKR